MARKKKNPTPSPAKTIGAGLPNETRKGSDPSVPVAPWVSEAGR